MDLRNAVALVTGANRGLGKAFVQELLARDVKKVYAAARNPAGIRSGECVEPICLDITRASDIAVAARTCPDVDLLVNNAGISGGHPFLGPQGIEAAQAQFETNVFGPLRMTRAFAPILAANGGGVVVNILSVLSWLSLPGAAAYSASKAAAWSLTNGLRHELREQRTRVVGVHVGFMDTDMVKDLDAPKTDPLDVARQVLEAVESGRDEVLADEFTRQIKRALSSDPGIYLTATNGVHM